MSKQAEFKQVTVTTQVPAGLHCYNGISTCKHLDNRHGHGRPRCDFGWRIKKNVAHPCGVVPQEAFYIRKAAECLKLN